VNHFPALEQRLLNGCDMNSEATGVTCYSHPVLTYKVSVRMRMKPNTVPQPLNNRDLRRKCPKARLRKTPSFSSSALEATLSACY
jgi:hypothetical protein